MQFLAVLTYLIVASVVVFLAIKLSDYVDLLDKKTSVSGAFLGGILLAAVTSLPELFTSFTATVLLKQNQYVVGNILGSDLFNTILFGIVYIIFFKNMIACRVSKHHLFSLGICGILYALFALASMVFDNFDLLWGWFNPVSILILLVYIYSVYKTPKQEEAENKTTDSKLTVKQIIILFILFSLLLVGASIATTYVVDWIVDIFDIGKTFGGALFLGVATSLPELTATITLCKHKNFDAAYGDILGSNVFNFIIFVITDALSFGCKDSLNNYTGTYVLNQSTLILWITGLISFAILFFTILFKIKGTVKDNAKWRAIYFVLSILLIGTYVVFLLLSNIDLNISFAPLICLK